MSANLRLNLFRRHGIAILFIIIFTGLAVAVYSSDGETVPFQIAIGVTDDAARGSDVSIPVYKIAGSEPIQEFHFVLTFDKGYSTFLGITPGEIFDIPGDFEWEFIGYEEETFHYPVYDSMYPPSQVQYIHVTGTADTANEPHQPLELVVPDSTILFYLDFHVSYNIASACNFLPLYFFWNDCGHNTIIYGDPYYAPGISVSDRVFVNLAGMIYEITDPIHGFPGYYGVTEGCLDSVIWDISNPIPFMDFYAGYISVACDSSNPVKGDVNLNGIAYEIGDLDLFFEYFTAGQSVFDYSTDSQITATDINGDANPLGIDDYVYLQRIITGEMMPESPTEDASYGVVFPVEAASQYKISAHFAIPVAGLYLGFYAPNIGSFDVTLLPAAEHMEYVYELRDDWLYIFIYDDLSSNPVYGTISSGTADIIDLAYSGTQPRLDFAYASGYYGENLDIYQDFTLDSRGDLNINGISYEIADAVIFVNYLLYGISALAVMPSYQLAATDINADGVVGTIEDLVYMTRIIDGTLYPVPNGPENFGTFDGNVYLAETDSSIIVRSNFEDSVGGLYLGFYAPDLQSYADYQIIPMAGAEHMNFGYDTSNDSLHILLYYLGPGDTVKTAIDFGYQYLFEIVYTGNKPEFGHASAAGYLAEYVSLTVTELQDNDQIPFEITIGQISGMYPDDILHLPVIKTGGSLPIGGFEFLFTYDTAIFNDLHVRWGDLHNRPWPNGWMYLNEEQGPFEGCDGNCPPGLTRVIGMPYYDGAQYYPDYEFVEDGTILFYLRVNIKSTVPDSALEAIRLYWVNCDDNIIYTEDSSGEFLAISNGLIDFDGTSIHDPTAAFPSQHGANSYCLDSLHMRKTVFYNGSIGIKNIGFPPFGIKIGQMNNVGLGGGGTVPVYVSNCPSPVAGFDLLVGYNADIITSIEATPGELYDSPGAYEWEYFNSRTGPFDGCSDECPSGLMRIVGVADINDGNPHATSQLIEEGTTLFNLDFQITEDTANECQFVFLEFFWIDCGDNAIAFGDPAGDSLALSHKAYLELSSGWIEYIPNRLSGFPADGGAQETCFEGSTDFTLRAADFYNGGFGIQCIYEIDDRGDVNLNGVAYEIADWVVFTNYFLSGLAAFTIDLGKQTAATDVYADGVYLSLQDLVYMAMVIKGDALPFPGLAPAPPSPGDNIIGILNILDTDTSIIISSDFSDSIGALHLCFYSPDFQDSSDYEIILHEGIDSTVIISNIHDDSLKVLLQRTISDSSYTAINPGVLDLFEIKYAGQRPLFSFADASGHNAEYVDMTINVYPDNPPVCINCPEQLTNDDNGTFAFTFIAGDDDMLDESFQYHIISGPGDIDSQTGSWKFNPLCEEIGTIYPLEICVSDNTHECPRTNPELHAIVELLISNQPPILGDCNHDGVIDLEDITYLISYVYISGVSPVPEPEVGDVDASGWVNLLDITYLIKYFYMNGPEPVCP